MAGVPVKLRPLEYTFAAYAGFLRQSDNLLSGRRDAYGFNGQGYDAHVVGAVAEFVVAKVLDVCWSGPGALRSADVGRSIQVRSSPRHANCLIVHPDNPDWLPFVFVTGCLLDYVVQGWLYGGEAKFHGWWREPHPGRGAYFVPSSALRGIETLSQYSEGRSHGW